MHTEVVMDKDGKCPKCGMTLIPVMQAPPVGPSEREEGKRASSPHEGAGASAALQAPAAPRSALLTLYTCPMAAHADVVSEKAGKCPKCEMQLVATSTVPHGKMAEETWRKAQAGAP